MPEFIRRIDLPREVFSLGLPVGIFLIMIGVGFGAGDVISSGSNDSGDNEETAIAATVATAAPSATAVPVATATTEPTPAPTGSQAAIEQPRAADTTAVSQPAPVSGYVGAQTALGDRLVIPSIGVDTPVSSAVVSPNGVMPDPSGYFNVVWYDFRNHPGLGGYATGGNLVIAGHVD